MPRIAVKAVGIAIKGVNNYSQLEIDICKDCLKAKGFIVEKPPTENSEKHNAITLEDKLYDILEDMGVSFVEN